MTSSSLFHRLPSSILRLSLAVSLIVAGIAVAPTPPVFAAASLTIEPITWNVIGLDSNNVNVGPNDFPIGARVCNTGDVAATNVTATFVWDSANSYIDNRPGTNTTLSVSSLAAGACTDFYFEVEVDRDSNAYDTTRDYHIEVTADTLGTISTPTPRTLYVEHLVSQNRNAVTDVQYGTSIGSLTSVPAGGTMTLVVGNTYFIKLVGFTATQGYEQLESFINIPNTIFQTLAVTTTYTADTSPIVSSPNDKAYSNACNWDNDPNSPTYRSCLGVGKTGGDITVTYQVKILQVPSAPLVNPAPLSTLIYDFSGSSYHYNSDFSTSTRYANIVNATIVKAFSPKTITPGGTSTLTFTITNPGADPISSTVFTDTLPSGVSVAGTPNLSYSGCGGSESPAFLSGGETSLSFSNITVSGNSTCTISLDVTAAVDGTYDNTSGNLFINSTVDTGSFGTDSLVVSSLPPAPSSCVTPSTLATWTMPTSGTGSGGPPPPFTTKAADVATATSGESGGTFAIDTVEGNPVNSWSGSGWPTTGTITPPDPATIYYELTVDTSNYGGVRISFDYYMPNGDWAAVGNNFLYLYSKADSGSYNSGTGYSATKGSWESQTITYTATSTGVSTTSFRISAAGAKTTPTDGVLYLDNLIITGCPLPTPPELSKNFSPGSIVEGSTSTLTFIITNTNSSTALSGISFSDTLPTGLTVATSSTSACGGTLTTTAPTTISLTGGTLGAGATCIISVTVTGSTAGDYDNISGNVSATESGANTTSTGYGTSSLEVVAPPVIAKSFGASSILTGTTTSLTFSINNPNLSATLTGVNFTDSLPAGLVVATPNGLTGSCGGGTITATAGSSTISLTSASLTAGQTCTFSVDVLGTALGVQTNSVTVSSTNGGTGNTATADVLVKDPTPIISLLKQVSTDVLGPWLTYVAVTVGVDVYYQITVENTGDAALSNVDVTDPDVDLTSCAWEDGDGDPLIAPFTLAVAAPGNNNHIATCIVGPITSSSGSNPNTAEASGVYSSTTVTDTSTATYATTGLTLDKSAAQSTFVDGTVLTYTFVITNTGFAMLEGPVTVSDDKSTDETCPAMSTVGDGDNWFEVGESLICMATYTAMADDVSTGAITNTASAMVDSVTSNTDSVTVPLASINAVNDSGSTVNGTTGGTSLANVLTNDTLNGGAATLANVTLSFVSSTDPGVTLDLTDGSVDVAPGTAAGSYTLTYQICDQANPTLCDTATVTVTVVTIDAVNDSGATINGATGGTSVANVLTNDTLNGGAATLANVNLSFVSSTDPGVTLDLTDGSVDVAPGTASGSYTLTYQICDQANPTICDTAVVTVPVVTIDAVNDSGTTINGTTGGTSLANVLTNDTLNGAAATLANVNLSFVSSTDPGVTLDLTDGSVDVAPGTAAGNYTLTYQICDQANPTICDTAVVTVPVVTIDAVNDSGSTINGTTGGTSVTNVLTNDTLNGAAATLATVTLSFVSSSDPGVTLDTTDGSVDVAAGTAAGTYTLTYQICDLEVTTICDTAIVTVPVVTIDAVDDTGSTINGATGGTSLANVLTNDTLNGAAATLANVTLSFVSSTNPGVTLDTTDGSVDVAPGTASGSYTLTYQICDQANPTICDTAVVTVPVVTIDAVDDSGSTINGATGGTSLANVLTNDTLNGAAATLATVTLSFVSSSDPGVTLDTTTGAVDVAAGTAAGTYTLTYQICDQANPTICDTAVVTVPVVTIDAVNDSGAMVNSTTGGTSLANVLTNDTLNGLPATLANVTLSFISSTNPGVTLDLTDGSVDVTPGTAAGNYTLTYQICDQANPTICDTATVTVPVGTPPDLQLAKTDGGVSPLPGGIITYTLTYTNAGMLTATGVVITETVPNNTRYNAAASLPTVWSCPDGSLAGTICTTPIGSVAGGGSGSVRFAVQVDNPLPSSVTSIFNTATIADDGSNGPDPTPVNNTGTVGTIPTAVTLLYFQVAGVTGQQITLSWATETEIDHYGFILYRAATNDFSQATPVHFEPATLPGGSGGGATYDYTETVPTGGQWWYWLADVDTHGQETLHGSVSATVGVGGQTTYFLYLPLVTGE